MKGGDAVQVNKLIGSVRANNDNSFNQELGACPLAAAPDANVKKDIMLGVMDLSGVAAKG